MIELSDFSIKFLGETLLSSINLVIPKGSFFCLIGESGGGKTLIGRAMLNLLPPNLEVSGKRIDSHSSMELILQNPMGSLQSSDTIRKQFDHLLQARGLKGKQKRAKQMQDLLRLVGFSDVEVILSKFSYQLSGGMCQKVAIAMALSAQPEGIVADEPTSALDVESQKNILTLLEELHQIKQMTIVFITHDLEIVQKYGTHVGIVKQGQLIETGTVEKVGNDPQESYTKELFRLFEAGY